MRLLVFSLDPKRLGLPRLPKALQKAGFQVAALCPSDSLLAKTRYLEKIFPLSTTRASHRLSQQLVQALQTWKPVMVIPGDEMAVALLHYLVQEATRQPERFPAEVIEVLRFSLGDPSAFVATTFKHETQQVARTLGLRTPENISVTSWEETQPFIARVGFPVVLKQDFSWSGEGVKVCFDEGQLAEALPGFLPIPPHPLKTRLRRWLKRDWYPTTGKLSLQSFVRGTPAMYALVALKGEVLAGFGAIPEQTTSATGPSSVVRCAAHPEMADAAVTLTRHFGFSGFAGFDFMIEAQTGAAYLLECNPRPIPIGHLGGLLGVDLCQALFDRLQGRRMPVPSAPDRSSVVVSFFPQEWRRDPASPHLASTYHDVPWDDPKLLSAYLEAS